MEKRVLMKRLLFAILLCASLVAACGTTEPTVVAVPPTATAEPTATAVPLTATLEPAATAPLVPPTQTATPTDTATPAPTDTPLPTDTPTPLPTRTGSGGVPEPLTMTHGGPHNDRAFDVLVTEDGGSLIAGLANNTRISHRITPGNAWLIRTDAEGAILWEKQYGGDDDAAFPRSSRRERMNTCSWARSPRPMSEKRRTCTWSRWTGRETSSGRAPLAGGAWTWARWSARPPMAATSSSETRQTNTLTNECLREQPLPGQDRCRGQRALVADLRRRDPLSWLGRGPDP